jgi:hypothetical protein
VSSECVKELSEGFSIPLRIAMCGKLPTYWLRF